MSQKAIEDVLKRVTRLINWWVEQERLTGKSHKVLTISDEDMATLKADPPAGRICGVGGYDQVIGLTFQEFLLVRSSDKKSEETW